jgi:hypothetical protein
MTRTRISGRRWPTALLIAALALVIGAVFGAAQTGQAAAKDKPSNTAPPTVSGTPQSGSQLTTTNGTWAGTTPITYKYQWSRCDSNGGSCSDIGGATAHTYDLKQVDVANTLRVEVTATNSDGSASSTSTPTAQITAPSTPAPTGCPSGTGVINISDLSLPAQLTIGGQSVAPGVIGRSSQQINVSVHVTACGGRPVQGAVVYATAVPFNQYTVPAQTPTGADGSVTLAMNQQSGFPAARRQQLLAMFIRASKPGDPQLGGVSARRLISFPVDLRH